MPVPLILIPAAAIAGLGVLIGVVARKLGGKRVAVLGGQKVGKTTLLRHLRDQNDVRASTVRNGGRGKISMESDGKSIDFRSPKDLPGDDGLAYSGWKQAFVGADYVLYLFRSDLIARGDPSELRLVKSHLDMFKDWLDAAKSSPPRIVLIGTWADRDFAFTQDPEKFQRHVGSASPIKAGLVKLNHAGLVVGSLRTEEEAMQLIKQLGARLS